MGIFITLAILFFLILLGFLITWIIGFIAKKQTVIKVGKIGSAIVGSLFLISLICTGTATHIHNKQVAEEQRIKKQKNKKFKKQLSAYKTDYVLAILDAEDTAKSENKAWEDSIDDSDDDYDVEDAVSKIVDDNEDDISEMQDKVSSAKSKLDSMKKNDTGTYDYAYYKKSYKNLDKLSEFVSSPTGSYSDFISTFNDLHTDCEDILKD